MTIIRSGGVNWYIDADHPDYKNYGRGNSFLVQLSGVILDLAKQGEIAIVTVAKENPEFFHEHIAEAGLGDLLDQKKLRLLHDKDNADWGNYKAVLLMGGSNARLHNWLSREEFSIDKLTNTELLAGDSAGAFALGSHMINKRIESGKETSFLPGFMPDSGLIFGAHSNNPKYFNADLGEFCKEFAEENNCKFILLAENQLYFQ